MSWYNMFDCIKTKISRYLLQRYLGKFFQSKLNIEQLKINLYNGKADLQNVTLNVETFNDLFESQGCGFEFVSGHIGKLTVKVPWQSLMTLASSIEASDLIIVLRPIKRQPTGASMLESMWSSVSSSIQMAEECMNQRDDDAQYETHSNSIEGVQKFAETIENVLNRIQAKFTNVTIKIEHALPSHGKELSLFVQIRNIEYKNETAYESYCSGKSSSGSQTKSETERENPNLMPSISKHNILINGCVVSTSECTISSLDKCNYSNLDWNQITQLILEAKKIQIIELKGTQKITIKAKQIESAGPKACLDIELGSIYAFLTPRQIHQIIKLVQICYGESNDQQQQQQQTSSTESLQSHKMTMPYAESVASSIHNFKGNWCQHPGDVNSIYSNATTLQQSHFNEMNINMDDSFSTFASTISTCRTKPNMFDTTGEILRFNVQITSINAIALHKDILRCGDDPYTFEIISDASIENLKKLSSDFFSSVLDHETASDAEEFHFVCEKDCLYLKIYPLFIIGTQKRNHKMLVSTTNVTAKKLDFYEVLNKRSEHLVMFDRTMYCAEGYQTQPEFSLSMQSSFSCAQNSTTTSIDIELAECTIEADISIYDRLSSLFSMSPFYVTKSKIEQENKANEVSNSTLEIIVHSTLININLRFPVVDAKTFNDPESVQWWKRNIRDDQLVLKFYDAIFTINGLTTTIAANEIIALYSDPSCYSSKQIFKATFLEDNQPRISIQTKCNSKKKKYPVGSPFSAQFVWRQSDVAHSMRDRTEENSFLPGETDEINHFCNCAMQTTELQINVHIPFIEIMFESKELYEVIYNRLNSDLLMWKPSSPLYRLDSDDSKNSSSNSIENPYFEHKLNLLDSCMESKCMYNSDSSIYHSANEELPNPNLSKRKKKGDQASNASAIEVCIDGALISFFVPARDADSQILAGQFGKFNCLAKDFKLFAVNGYNQNANLNYVCLQLNEIEVHHCGNLPFSDHEDFMDVTFYSIPKQPKVKSEPETRKEVIALVVEIKREPKQRVKRVKVSTGINKAVLAQIPGEPNSWLNQLLDFFDIADYPIDGYNPYALVTELQIHFWNCAVDYRPENFPYHSFVKIGFFTISSNVISTVAGSNLRFIAEDCSLSIAPSDNLDANRNTKIEDLVQASLVNVVELGLFDISMRLNSKPGGLYPKMDLRCLIKGLHVRTCFDSAKALAQLIGHLANDNNSKSNEKECEAGTDEILSSYEMECSQMASKQRRVSLLLADAIKEEVKDMSIAPDEARRVYIRKPEIFYFPDENNKAALSSAVADAKNIDTGDADNELFAPLIQLDLGNIEKPKKAAQDEDNDFYFVKRDELGFTKPYGISEIKVSNEPLRIVDNHFSLPEEKPDVFRTPAKLPIPDYKYTLCEMTFVWYLYGGNDFIASPTANEKMTSSKSNTSLMSETYKNGVSQPTGNSLPTHCSASVHCPCGTQRNVDKKVEIEITKLSFCHEVYPEDSMYASRQMFLISDIEVRDRMRTTDINKLLYHPNPNSLSTKNNQQTVTIKALHVRPNPEQSTAEECSLRISILPIKLNIDQETLLFLEEYFVNLTNSSLTETAQNEKPVSRSQTDDLPVLSVEEAYHAQKKITENLDFLIDENKDVKEQSKAKINEPKDRPTYFREVIFSPALPISFDYQGRRIELSRGPLTGLLMGLAQLQGSSITLREIEHRRGILGWNKLINYLCREWLKDIRRNQLPNILSGLGPTNAVLQLFQGIYDLFRLPIEQYQRDGRIIRGFQLGAQSFSARTAVAALDLTSRVIYLLQLTAETTFDMLSSGPSIRKRKRSKYAKKRHNRPKDLREGVNNAYTIVKEGINNSANNLIETAVIEHDQKGYTGAVGAVMRQIPQLMVCPAVLATQATNNILGGAKSSLIPEAKLEAREKWRDESH